jgi:hypothetical protein
MGAISSPTCSPICLHICLQWLPGIPKLIPAHRIAGQQHDNLCGVYWASLLLNTFGEFHTTPETMATLAGSLLPIGISPDWVPPGATNRQDYCLDLPIISDPDQAGTAAAGLVYALTQASQDQFCAIPLQANWTGEQIMALLQLCQQHPDWQAMPICNIHTKHLWGSQMSLVDWTAYLSGTDIRPPAADWDVGHFFLLAGIVTGPVNSLIVVQDTYPVFGWDGYHLQPPAAIAAAIQRADSPTQGGILLFVATQYQTQVEQAVEQIGFVIELWDNGTPVQSALGALQK